MKNKTHLTIAVASDLHIYQKLREGNVRPSHASIDRGSSLDWKSDPIEGLKRHILEQKLTADILLCPGDLGDRADPLCVAHGWRLVHEIGKCLKVRLEVGHKA